MASFNRPGSNATGIRHYNKEIISKRLELLKELVVPQDTAPAALKIAFLINDDATGLEDQRAQIQGVKDTAEGLGLVMHLRPEEATSRSPSRRWLRSRSGPCWLIPIRCSFVNAG